jgi:hypothetical protein
VTLHHAFHFGGGCVDAACMRADFHRFIHVADGDGVGVTVSVVRLSAAAMGTN